MCSFICHWVQMHFVLHLCGTFNLLFSFSFQLFPSLPHLSSYQLSCPVLPSTFTNTSGLPPVVLSDSSDLGAFQYIVYHHLSPASLAVCQNRVWPLSHLWFCQSGHGQSHLQPRLSKLIAAFKQVCSSFLSLSLTLEQTLFSSCFDQHSQTAGVGDGNVAAELG